MIIICVSTTTVIHITLTMDVITIPGIAIGARISGFSTATMLTIAIGEAGIDTAMEATGDHSETAVRDPTIGVIDTTITRHAVCRLLSMPTVAMWLLGIMAGMLRIEETERIVG
tara:strand:+ start:506 stop:847 length:342 start_codon:yes stop_codon:yes gene_type:complete